MRLWSWLIWPLGVLLVTAHIEGLPTPAFAALDVLYVIGGLMLLRHLAWQRDPLAASMVATGFGIFALVGICGEPSAEEPTNYLLNTGFLLAVAVVEWVALVQLFVRERRAPGFTALVPVLGLLTMGTTVYLANLLARVAVVVSGASGQQAAVEDTAWVAYEYLRGLPGAPDPMAYLLVWLDLLQLAYVAASHLAVAAVAVRLGRNGRIAARAATGIALVGRVLAGCIVLGVLAAVSLPHGLDLVPAWAAFVASIPFTTTLLPFALGAALLRGRAVTNDRDPVRTVAAVA